MNDHVSFTQEKRFTNEWNTDIILMYVKYALDHNNNPHPFQIITMNYRGKVKFNQKIAPRVNIKEYFPMDTQLNDIKLPGEMYEEEAIVQIYYQWKNTLIIGHNLKIKLRCL